MSALREQLTMSPSPSVPSPSSGHGGAGTTTSSASGVQNQNNNTVTNSATQLQPQQQQQGTPQSRIWHPARISLRKSQFRSFSKNEKINRLATHSCCKVRLSSFIRVFFLCHLYTSNINISRLHNLHIVTLLGTNIR